MVSCTDCASRVCGAFVLVVAQLEAGVALSSGLELEVGSDLSRTLKTGSCLSALLVW